MEYCILSEETTEALGLKSLGKLDIAKRPVKMQPWVWIALTFYHLLENVQQEHLSVGKISFVLVYGGVVVTAYKYTGDSGS